MKPRRTKVSPQIGAKPVASGLLEIPLEKLADHPGNPDPTEAEILSMMQWLVDEQQQEPLTVRELAGDDQPIGHYQVLAGKTRLAAARRLGLATLTCRVRDDLADDGDAARFAMKNNLMRREENPLRKIRWVKYLVEQGEPAKAAGSAYGWSESYTRSMLGLLNLPAKWIERIESGELPPTAAVRLNPYASVKPIMAALEKAWKVDWQREAMCDKSRIGNTIARVIREVTRPIEPKVKHDYGWQLGNDHPRYFAIASGDDKALQIVSLPIGKNGKLMRVALNVKKYDQLQIPLIKEKLAERSQESGGGSRKKGSRKKAADMTPAEARKEAKRKRAEADAKLQSQLVEWEHRMLRLGCAQAIMAKSHGAEEISELLPWALIACTTHCGGGAFQMAPVDAFLIASWRMATGRMPSSRQELPMGGQMHLLEWILHTRDPDGDPISEAEQVQRWLLYLIFWPRVRAEAAAELEAINTELPWGVRLPELKGAAVERIAARLKVTIADLWKRAVEPQSQQREMLRVFLELHTRDQLNDLAKEIAFSRTAPDSPMSAAKYIAEQKTKAAAVDAFLALHTPVAPLSVPKSLAPPAKRKKK